MCVCRNLCHWVCGTLSKEDLFRDANVGSRSSCVGDFFSSYSQTGFLRSHFFNIRALAASWGAWNICWVSFTNFVQFFLFFLVNSSIFLFPLVVNGTPASQLSTPHSAKSPSPSPTSPGSLKKRRVRQYSLFNHTHTLAHMNMILRSSAVHLVDLISSII